MATPATTSSWAARWSSTINLSVDRPGGTAPAGVRFDDSVRFTRPPRVVQTCLFGLLSPLARAPGHRGSYPWYLSRGPSGSGAVPADGPADGPE